MAKAPKNYTDAERQASIDKMVVGPEQQAIIDKMVADAADLAKARKTIDKATAPAPAPAPAKPERGHSLLSADEIAKGQAYYESLLNENPKRWRPQQAAAKHVAVKFYKLHEGSWQTVEDRVVIPVLERRGLRKKK